MSHKFLVISEESEVTDFIQQAIDSGCVGILRGVPASLAEIASNEGWSLPHIYEEVQVEMP